MAIESKQTIASSESEKSVQPLRRFSQFRVFYNPVCDHKEYPSKEYKACKFRVADWKNSDWSETYPYRFEGCYVCDKGKHFYYLVVCRKQTHRYTSIRTGIQFQFAKKCINCKAWICSLRQECYAQK